MTTLLDTALAYHRAGLVVLPNDPARKFPAGLSNWQRIAPTEHDIRRWFGKGQHAIGVRDVEGLDFDNKGEPDAETLYADWSDLVERTAPGLASRLLCERTPSGGFHLVWKCAEIAGNQKLATRPPTEKELEQSPRLTAVSLIETRGRGGQFQVAPSPGYTLLRGNWAALPTITPQERSILLQSARALSRADKRVVSLATRSDTRSGDRFNVEGIDEAFALLLESGWAIAYERDGVKYLTRPGKTEGISATFGYVGPGVLYVFTTNAAPFQDGRAYAPFSIYTELKHNGDYTGAARDLHVRYEGPRKTVALRRPQVDPATGEVLDWRSKGMTAAQLYRTEFAPLHWTIENVLPEGAAVLAGKPKSRKSWAALGAAVACVTGGRMFDRLQARQGKVLYLDLESNQRRMRGRLFSMIGHKMQDMDNLHIYTEWPHGEEGITELEHWMVAHPDTILIVIDVLADFRRPRDPKEDPYTYDRETVKPINAFAEKHRITVLLVHHTRKAKADDVFDEISGSTGLPSAVATMWVLGRAPNGSGEMVLALRGRDVINDDPLALEWDDYQNQFVVVGGAADALQGAERRAVLKVMSDDLEWGPKEIAAEVKKSVNSVQFLMKALLADGLVEKTGRGKYVRVVPTQNTQNAQNTHIPQNTQSVDSVSAIDTQNHTQNGLDLHKAINSPSVYSVSLSKGSDDDNSTF